MKNHDEMSIVFVFKNLGKYRRIKYRVIQVDRVNHRGLESSWVMRRARSWVDRSSGSVIVSDRSSKVDSVDFSVYHTFWYIIGMAKADWMLCAGDDHCKDEPEHPSVRKKPEIEKVEIWNTKIKWHNLWSLTQFHFQKVSRSCKLYLQSSRSWPQELTVN